MRSDWRSLCRPKGMSRWTKIERKRCQLSNFPVIRQKRLNQAKYWQKYWQKLFLPAVALAAEPADWDDRRAYDTIRYDTIEEFNVDSSHPKC